jgi:sortase A
MIVRIRFRIRWLSDFLLIAGVSLLAFVLWSELDTARYQAIQSHRFEQSIQLKPRVPEKSITAPVEPADPVRQQGLQFDPLLVGRLEIPRLGLTAMVREGVGYRTLQRAVGHVPGTALPGQPGNFVVAGHRDTFFHELRSIRNGDEIRITTLAGVFKYSVDALSIVAPDDLEPVQQTGAPICTLITCFPFDFLGSAPRRFIVRAQATEPSP